MQRLCFTAYRTQTTRSPPHILPISLRRRHSLKPQMWVPRRLLRPAQRRGRGRRRPAPPPLASARLGGSWGGWGEAGGRLEEVENMGFSLAFLYSSLWGEGHG